MAGDVVNIKVCNSLELRSGLTGNYHAICHYSYNLPKYRMSNVVISDTCTLIVFDNKLYLVVVELARQQ